MAKIEGEVSLQEVRLGAEVVGSGRGISFSRKEIKGPERLHVIEHPVGSARAQHPKTHISAIPCERILCPGSQGTQESTSRKTQYSKGSKSEGRC